jgi:hypothetical protein
VLVHCIGFLALNEIREVIDKLLVVYLKVLSRYISVAPAENHNPSLCLNTKLNKEVLGGIVCVAL